MSKARIELSVAGNYGTVPFAINNGDRVSDVVRRLMGLPDFDATFDIPQPVRDLLAPNLVVPICSGFVTLRRDDFSLSFLDEGEELIYGTKLTTAEGKIVGGLLQVPDEILEHEILYGLFSTTKGKTRKKSDPLISHINSIRRKTGPFANHFVNKFGVGYGFFTDPNSR